MSTPKHTYTYQRAGCGDVIVLAPEGHPYTITPSIPSGWSASYWYATDRLASIHDFSQWTEFSAPGTVPAGASKVAVNIELAPTSPILVPGAPKPKVTMATNNYKAASGLQYTDSGSHFAAFDGPSRVYTPPGAPLLWLDYTDESTVFSDVAGLIPATEGDLVQHITNKGSLGGFFSEKTPPGDLTYERDTVTGKMYAQSGAQRSEAAEPHNLDLTIAALQPWSFATICFADGTNSDSIYSISRGGGVLVNCRPHFASNTWSFSGNDVNLSSVETLEHPVNDDEWVAIGWGHTHNTLNRQIQVGAATEFVDNAAVARNEMVVSTTANHQMMDMEGGVREVILWPTNIWESQFDDYKAYVQNKAGRSYPFAGAGRVP